MNFDGILILTAKIGFSLFLFLLAIRWLVLIPYLWFKYDKRILGLKKELDDFRKREKADAVGRGIVASTLDMRINSKSKEVNEKLDILETKRRLFLERVNLILSIISVNKS